MLRTLLAILLLLTAPALAQPGYPMPQGKGEPIRVLVDGQVLAFDQPPRMVDGRVLVPLRGIFERLGAEVSYFPAARSIRALRGDTQVELKLGSRDASVQGRPVALDVPAMEIGGRTLVPLRFVSESLGAKVQWSEVSQTVSVASGTAVTPPPAEGLAIDSLDFTPHQGLAPGDPVTVELRGTPGCKATFEVPGHIPAQALREAEPGHYRGTYTVPRNLKLHQQPLTGHLRKGRQEAVLQSSARLTLGQGAPEIQVSPTGNAASLRPALRGVFAGPVQPGSARLWLDGQERTDQTRWVGHQITWTPNYDLDYGEHNARVEALGPEGQVLERRWKFNVGAGAVRPGPFALQVTNLQAGSMVPQLFDVHGLTAPGARVAVTVRVTRALRGQGKVFRGNGVARADGQFDVPVRLGPNILPGSQMTVQAQATSGRQKSNPVSLVVIHR